MKRTIKPPELPRCEVHDGHALAVKQVIWNGKPTWVCGACLAGR